MRRGGGEGWTKGLTTRTILNRLVKLEGQIQVSSLRSKLDRLDRAALDAMSKEDQKLLEQLRKLERQGLGAQAAPEHQEVAERYQEAYVMAVATVPNLMFTIAEIDEVLAGR